MKLKNSNYDKTQISKRDENQISIVMKIENSSCDKTQKLKL